MGQLVVKFKQLCENLLPCKKFKNPAGERSKLEIGQDVPGSTSQDPGNKEGDDLNLFLLDEEEKLEYVENVMELLDYQKVRIESLEDRMEKVLQQVEENNEALKVAGVRNVKKEQRRHIQKYEQLEKEVKIRLEHQQRLLDHLFAGFIVAFIIIVVICMIPMPVFPWGHSSSSGKSFLDSFWAFVTGVDKSPT